MDQSSPPDVSKVDIVDLGGLDVSIIISTFLYAISCSQVFVYWRSGFGDGWLIRCLVASVWILETIHSVMFWAHQYRLTVTLYGNADAIKYGCWALNYSLVVHGLITAFVQAYYSFRLYALSGWIMVSVLSWTGSLLEVVGSCYGTYALVTAKGPYPENLYRAITATAALDVLIDIINTSSLCYCLYKRRTAARNTNDIITTIVRWTIESGMVTAFMAVGIMVTAIVTPHTAIFTSITAFYSKLYSNSLLASLNSRGPFGPTKLSRHHKGVVRLRIRTTQETIEVPSYRLATMPSLGDSNASSGTTAMTNNCSTSGDRRVGGDIEAESESVLCISADQASFSEDKETVIIDRHKAARD